MFAYSVYSEAQTAAPLYDFWSGNSEKRNNFILNTPVPGHIMITVTIFRVKLNVGNFLWSWANVAFWRRNVLRALDLVSDLLIALIIHWIEKRLNKSFYPIYTDNCNIIRYNDKRCVVKLLNFSVFIDHLHEGIQQQTINYWLVITQMCNNALKIQNIKTVSKF